MLYRMGEGGFMGREMGAKVLCGMEEEEKRTSPVSSVVNVHVGAYRRECDVGALSEPYPKNL